MQRKRRTRQKRNIPVAVVLALRTNIWVSIWLNPAFRKTMRDFNNAVRCSKICLGLFIWIKPKVPPLFQCNLCFYCAQKPKWIKLVAKCWHLISLIPRHNMSLPAWRTIKMFVGNRLTQHKICYLITFSVLLTRLHCQVLNLKGEFMWQSSWLWG